MYSWCIEVLTDSFCWASVPAVSWLPPAIEILRSSGEKALLLPKFTSMTVPLAMDCLFFEAKTWPAVAAVGKANILDLELLSCGSSWLSLNKPCCVKQGRYRSWQQLQALWRLMPAAVGCSCRLGQVQILFGSGPVGFPGGVDKRRELSPGDSPPLEPPPFCKNRKTDVRILPTSAIIAAV